MIRFFKYKYIPLLLFILVGIYYVYKALYSLPHDFANYYYAAYFLENGKFDIQIYDPTWFNLEVTKNTKNAFVAYAPNTPFLSILFLPFTLFSFEFSKLLFNSISLFLFTFSLFRIFKFYKIDLKYLLLLLFVFIIPIKNNLLFGQVYFLLFFLISEGFLAFKKKKLILMSLLWSFAILLKVFPILLFMFLILEKKWKAFSYLFIACLILFLSMIFINGIDSWLFYFQSILPKASNGEISTEFVKNYQSFLMFFKHLFIDSIYNETNLFASQKMYLISLNTVKSTIILFGIYFSFKEKNTLKKFSYWIISFYLLSPYSSSYGSILLIFPLLILFTEVSKKRIIMASICVFVYGNLKFDLIGNSFLVLSFFKLFSLMVFFYVMFIYNTIVLKKHLVILVISLLINSVYYSYQNIEKKIEIPSITDNNIALTTDYCIEKDTVFYSYWNEQGPKTERIKLDVLSSSVEEVNIKNNIIYINNKKIALPKSNKKKAMLINKTTLLYLSDLNRGYGFYSLRKLKLKIDE